MANGKSIPDFDSLIESYLNHYGFITKKDIISLEQKVEQLEKILGGKQTDTSQINKDYSRYPQEQTASMQVLEVISEKKQGAKFDDIQAKTQFDDKKIRNIVYRLKKQGKIRRLKQGLYVADIKLI